MNGKGCTVFYVVLAVVLVGGGGIVWRTQYSGIHISNLKATRNGDYLVGTVDYWAAAKCRRVSVIDLPDTSFGPAPSHSTMANNAAAICVGDASAKPVVKANAVTVGSQIISEDTLKPKGTVKFTVLAPAGSPNLSLWLTVDSGGRGQSNAIPLPPAGGGTTLK